MTRPWSEWPENAVAVIGFRAGDPRSIPAISTERRPCWQCGHAVALAPMTLREAPQPNEILCLECCNEYERQRGEAMECIKPTPRHLAEIFRAMVEHS